MIFFIWLFLKLGTDIVIDSSVLLSSIRDQPTNNSSHKNNQKILSGYFLTIKTI